MKLTDEQKAQLRGTVDGLAEKVATTAKELQKRKTGMGIGFTRADVDELRDHPLVIHCRKLLQLAGKPVDDATLGPPEIMAWAVENDAVSLPYCDFLDPAETVMSLMRYKPRTIMRALGETEDEGNTDLDHVLATDDPAEAAGILIGTMMLTLEARL